jgi:two-component system sensor histidine kinase BaeS
MSVRHSLLTRLLAGSVFVAVCSITATAWLASQSTSGAIRREQGQTLASDANINDTLLGYAATHPNWDGAVRTVRDLAHRTGRRIALTTESRELLADSAPGSPLPTGASATVDPLRVSMNLVPGATADPIDSRAVAPFGLPASVRSRLITSAESQATCLRKEGYDARVVYGLSGRPDVRTAAGGESLGALSRSVPEPRVPVPEPRVPVPEPRVPVPAPSPPISMHCESSMPPSRLTPAENTALKRLNTMVDKCLAKDRLKILLALDGTWEYVSSSRGDRKVVSECIVVSRRAQLKPYVAPAALLFIGNPGDTTAHGVQLTTAGMTRIGAAALVVLVLSVGVSGVIATRLVRPVRALTDAAQRMREGDGSARVTINDSGEVGRLAAAFNDMSEHLERLESQRKEMVSDVSHELRTPLSNVRGWLEAARDGYAELDPELISSLVDEMLLLQHVVDELQSLALADAGKLRLHPEQVYAAELLEQVGIAHRGRAEACGLELITEIHGDPELVADPVRLRQALGNLVSNALRYTPTGGRVTLRACESEGHVLIEVVDTGTGIDSEALPHVFDRFWRAEKSRSRRTGGSGLGLAIVRSFIDAHGGTVSVTSTPGEGTTFTVRLPDSQEEAGVPI